MESYIKSLVQYIYCNWLHIQLLYFTFFSKKINAEYKQHLIIYTFNNIYKYKLIIVDILGIFENVNVFKIFTYITHGLLFLSHDHILYLYLVQRI